MTPPNVALYNWIHQAFDFRSRSTRSDYWWTRLFVLVIYVILMFVFLSGLSSEQTQSIMDWSAASPQTFEVSIDDFWALSSLSKFTLTFGVVFSLLTFIPDISVSWRRFQDMGRPGWLHILFMIFGRFNPFAPLIEFIWFAFPGTRGPNRYGPDKLNITPPDVF